ncbi:MAG: autotransporter-associated beta strand repeat-containing protein [Pirellulales bacterium]
MMFASIPLANAQVSQWQGGTTGNWGDSINWSPSVPSGPGAAAIWPIAELPAVQVQLTEPRTVGRLEMANPESWLSLGGAGGLTIATTPSPSGIAVTAPLATLSIANPLAVDGADPLVIHVGATSQVLIGAPLPSAAGGLVKAGPGTLILPATNSPFSGELRIDAGLTLVPVGGGLGTADQPTRLRGGELELRAGGAEPLVVEGGRLTVATELLDSPVSWSGGMIRLGGTISQVSATLQGPVDVTGSVQMLALREGGQLSGALSGGGTLETIAPRSTIQFSSMGQFTGTIRHRMGQLTLPQGTAAGSRLIVNGQLSVPSQTTLGTVRLEGNSLFAKSGSIVPTIERLELAGGTMAAPLGGVKQLVLDADRTIFWRETSLAELPNVEVERGTFRIDRAINDAAGARSVHVTSPTEARVVVKGFTVGHDIFLNNSQGIDGQGSLMLAGLSRLKGRLDLGDIGSTIGAAKGDGQPVLIEGPITGGGLTWKGLTADLSSSQITYTGPTKIDVGILRIVGAANLASTSEVLIDEYGTLELIRNRQLPQVDRLADNIPVRLTGGTLRSVIDQFVGTEPWSTEKIGVVELVRGKSLLSASNATNSDVPSLEIAELRRQPGAVVRVEQSVSLKDPAFAVGQILPGWYGAGTGWYRLNASGWGDSVPMSQVELNAAVPSDIVDLQQISFLDQNAEIFGLFARSGASIDLQGNTLTIGGGLITTQSDRNTPFQIAAGNLTAGDQSGNELMFGTGATRVSGSIVDRGNTPITVLVEDYVKLAGQNTYTGKTYVHGDLDLETQGALSPQTRLVLDGGRARITTNQANPFQVGVVDILGQQSFLSTVDQGQKVSIDTINLHRGGIGLRLTGQGVIHKLSPDSARLNLASSVQSDFAGTVEIEEGRLDVVDANALGQAEVKVHENGQLFGTTPSTARVTMMGGTLRGQSVINSAVQVVSDSLLRPLQVSADEPDTVEQSEMFIKGPISGSGNLRLVGTDAELSKDMVHYHEARGKVILSGDNSSYTGTIQVDSGSLVLDHENAIKSATVRVLPGGVLNTTYGLSQNEKLRKQFAGQIELAGGVLAADISPSNTVKRLTGKVNVTAPSRVVSRPANNSITPLMLDGELVLGDQAGLTFFNLSRAAINGPIQVQGLTHITSEGGRIDLNGSVTAAAPQATLMLNGNVVFDKIVSYQAPNGTRLSVWQDGLVPELILNGAGKSLRGGGTFENAYRLSGGAIFSPGDGIGVTQFDSGLVLAAGSTVDYQLNLASDGQLPLADRVRVGGQLRVNGAPDVPVTIKITPEGFLSSKSILSPLRAFQTTVAVSRETPEIDLGVVVVDAAQFGSLFGMPDSGSIRATTWGNSLQLRYVPTPFADVNQDRRVDAQDLATIDANWTGALSSPPIPAKTFSQGDTDADGDVDTVDLTHGWIARTDQGETPLDDSPGILEYDPATGSLRVHLNGTGQLTAFAIGANSNAFQLGDVVLPLSAQGRVDQTAFQLGYVAGNITDAVSQWQLDYVLAPQLKSVAAVSQIVKRAVYADDQGGGGRLQITRLSMPELGDFNRDNDVDSDDLLALLEGWTGSLEPGIGKQTFYQGDLDWDRDVDSNDILQFLGNWTGSQAASTAVVVPEPTSGALLAWLTLLACLSLRNRRQ